MLPWLCRLLFPPKPWCVGSWCEVATIPGTCWHHLWLRGGFCAFWKEQFFSLVQIPTLTHPARLPPVFSICCCSGSWNQPCCSPFSSPHSWCLGILRIRQGKTCNYGGKKSNFTNSPWIPLPFLLFFVPEPLAVALLMFFHSKGQHEKLLFFLKWNVWFPGNSPALKLWV